MQCSIDVKNLNKIEAQLQQQSIGLMNPNKDLLTAATFRTIAVKFGLTATLHHPTLSLNRHTRSADASHNTPHTLIPGSRRTYNCGKVAASAPLLPASHSPWHQHNSGTKCSPLRAHKVIKFRQKLQTECPRLQTSAGPAQPPVPCHCGGSCSLEITGPATSAWSRLTRWRERMQPQCLMLVRPQHTQETHWTILPCCPVPHS